MKWVLFALSALIMSSAQSAVAREYSGYYGYWYENGEYGQWQNYHGSQPTILSVTPTTNRRLPDGTYIFAKFGAPVLPPYPGVSMAPASPYPERWGDPYSVPTSMPGRETVVVDGETLEVYRLQSHAGVPLSIGSGQVRILKTKDGKPRKVFVVE